MFSEEVLAEVVRKYPILYDKSSFHFKDRRKKLLAWTDVAKAAGLPDGKTAESAFRNLRNKYGREKRKLAALKTSGSGTKDAQITISELFPYLGWIEKYVQPRDTVNNIMQPMDPGLEDTIVSEQEEKEDNDDDSIISSVSATGSNLSSVTGKPKYRKRQRKSVEDQEKEEEAAHDKQIMQKIEEKLCSTGKKCEDSLYGELLTEKLKKLPYNTKLRAKHEIDNIMSKYLSMEWPAQQGTSQSSQMTNQFVLPAQPYALPSTPQMSQRDAYQHAFHADMTSSPNRAHQHETANAMSDSPVFNRQRQFQASLEQSQDASRYVAGTTFYQH